MAVVRVILELNFGVSRDMVFLFFGIFFLAVTNIVGLPMSYGTHVQTFLKCVGCSLLASLQGIMPCGFPGRLSEFVPP